MNDQELLRYSRHILLDGFDIAGQEKLEKAKVLIVGAGGLGCPAAMYLASSGVGHIVIADDDVVDLTNLQRQIAHGTTDVGSCKVTSLADTLRNINPLVYVEPLALRLVDALLLELVARVDLVLDCSDNFSTRLAINRACLLQKKPLVSGAAINAEGQVSVFNLSAESPCYSCLYGENDNEQNLTCSESGVLAPIVGIIGAMQALEAIKILAGYGETLDGRLLLLDAKRMEWRSLSMKKDACCAVCNAAKNPG
jgi:molybdopterin/thiamine biosynthesis adenylyltransferase